MFKKLFTAVYLLTFLLVAGCKKEEDPVPEDLFVGDYVLQEVLDEYDPEDPDLADLKFLAPDIFQVSKSDFFNPVTGELVTSYKFFIGEIFIGISEQADSGGNVLVGTQSCPNEDDLSGVSITIVETGVYRLNMLNCIGREVLADYSRTVPEE